MTIHPSSEPNITAFFLSSDLEKAAKIDTALKDHQLDFVYAIINRPECSKVVLKAVLKGCIDYDCSTLLAIEVIQKKVFENYEEKKTAVINAAEKGELDIVKELVKTDLDHIDLESKDREEAIKKAIGESRKILDATPINRPSLNQFLNIITTFLKKGPVSDDTRGAIISLAVRATDIALLGQLFDMPYAEDSRTSALLLAMQEGHLELAQQVFATGPILEEKKNLLFITAADSGYVPVIHQLLLSGAHISEEAGDEALENAASRGDLPVIQRILAGDISISEEGKGAALHHAVTGGYLEIVQALIANPVRIKKSEKNRALLFAADLGYLPIIQVLLPGSEGLLSDLVITAARGGHLVVIEALLAGGAAISNQERGRAVIGAAKRGHLAVVEALLAGGATISNEDRGIAVIGAAESGNLAVVEALLAGGATISNEDRGRAVRYAAESGHLPIVQALLAGGATIPEHARALAIDAACSGRHYSIEHFLITGSVIVHEAPIIPNRLYINRHEMKETPALYLSQASNGFSGVTFLNPDGSEQEGIDAGGLTKQFIHDLLDGLFLKNIIEVDELRFPLCPLGVNEASYRDLGKFLSLIDQKNEGRTDRIYIGSLFNPDVFDFFKDFLDPVLSEHERIKKLADYVKNEETKVFSEFLNKEEPTDKELKDFRTFMEQVNYFEEGTYSDKTKQELDEMCKLIFKPYFKALSSIVSGFSDSLKVKILAQGKTYAEVLQGAETIDKDDLLAKIEVKQYAHLTQQQHLEVLKKRDWIFEKITSELAEDPKSRWVKDFLMAVTAQPVVPFGRIEIRGVEGIYCKSHTCFNKLDVPYTSLVSDPTGKTAEEIKALEKQLFFASLETLMGCTDIDLT